MEPIRFDRIAKSLTSRRSRRQVVARLGGVALAGIAGSGRCPGTSRAQTATPAVATREQRPVYPPIPVSTTLAPLFPAPDLYPVVGYDERGIVPVLGPSKGAAHDGFFGPSEQVPEVVGIADGEVLPIIDVFDAPPGNFEVAGPGHLPVIEATPTTEEGPCGIDDSQDVEFYNGALGVPRPFVDDHQPPVGNIQWNWNLHVRYPNEAGTVNGVRWCSGTLIAEDLFLTAGHCFEPDFGDWITPRVNGAPIGRTEIASNMRVNFNYQWGPEGPRPETSVAIAELLEDRLGGRDYAIVRLAQYPGPQFELGRIAAKDAPEGSPLCILGHPNQLPKRVTAGHASRYQGPRCFYNDLDTAGGTSGAGLLSLADGLLVGIHTNGGCGEQSGENHGFRIESLLEFSPILRGLVVG